MDAGAGFNNHGRLAWKFLISAEYPFSRRILKIDVAPDRWDLDCMFSSSRLSIPGAYTVKGVFAGALADVFFYSGHVAYLEKSLFPVRQRPDFDLAIAISVQAANKFFERIFFHHFVSIRRLSI